VLNHANFPAAPRIGALVGHDPTLCAARVESHSALRH